MAASPNRVSPWTLGACLALLVLVVLVGAWWTYRTLQPHGAAGQAAKKTAPQPSELNAAEENTPLIGEMGEFGEFQVPEMGEVSRGLLAQNLSRSPQGADPYYSDLGNLLYYEPDYRLTDDDYVPKAMGRGYLILPAK